MSQDEIKLDYDKAYAMADIFVKGAKQLEETQKQIKAVASALEEGALLGDGGSTFVELLQGPFATSLDRLTEKFNELNNDVLVAISAMQRADAESKQALSD